MNEGIIIILLVGVTSIIGKIIYAIMAYRYENLSMRIDERIDLIKDELNKLEREIKRTKNVEK